MYDGVVDAASVNDVSNRLYAVKLVLSRQIGKGQLSVGTEETFTDRRDRFTQSGFSADADDHLRQSYYSAFADYGITLGRFSLLAGLRYEHQRTKYFEAGVLNSGQSPTKAPLTTTFCRPCRSITSMATLSFRWLTG